MVKFSGPDVDLLLSNRAELLLALDEMRAKRGLATLPRISG